MSGPASAVMTNETINSLTLGDIKELRSILSGGSDAQLGTSMAIGRKVFIRSVTHYHVGRVVSVTAHEVVLDDASWVADSGKWGEALAKGTLSEHEPFPGLAIVRLRPSNTDPERETSPPGLTAAGLRGAWHEKINQDGCAPRGHMLRRRWSWSHASLRRTGAG